MKSVKIAIVGSRSFNDYAKLKDFIHQICELDELTPTTVISGGAKGADTLGAQYAKENNLKLLEFIPDWKTFGRSAGFKRNVDIIENCDVCFAFWDGVSHGTKHDIELCEQKGKRCYICRF